MGQESTTKKVARCGIYESRPQLCRDYPKIDQHIPEECTFVFVGDERQGSCACDVGACCNTPRENGEPGGAALSAIAGGKACKHLVWVDAPTEKTASDPLTVASFCCDLHELVGGTSDT